MNTPKTIRVKRNQASDSTNVGEFASGLSQSEGPWTEITVPGHFDADELDITIAHVKSLKQQRREAMLEALNAEMNIALRYPMEILAIIERVDAEFDQARDAEVTAELRAEVGRLREALKWYADPKNWEPVPGPIRRYFKANLDRGKRAREALGK